MPSSATWMDLQNTSLSQSTHHGSAAATQRTLPSQNFASFPTSCTAAMCQLCSLSTKSAEKSTWLLCSIKPRQQRKLHRSPLARSIMRTLCGGLHLIIFSMLRSLVTCSRLVASQKGRHAPLCRCCATHWALKHRAFQMVWSGILRMPKSPWQISLCGRGSFAVSSTPSLRL